MYGDTTFPDVICHAPVDAMTGTMRMTDAAALTFRRLMGRFATGVAVVLTDGEQGPIGLTVNSLTSLSLDPPLLLFCARNKSRAGRAVIARGLFSVNILSDAQQHISGYFAGQTEVWNMNACRRHLEWLTIPDCNAAMFCEVASTYPGGDHTIIVGAVREIVGPPTAKRPLLYHEGCYSVMHPHPIGACG